jgi:hypothetical protein
MRKFCWGFGIAGVLMLTGVVAAAHHAARFPHSFIGRVLHGASHVAAKLNPAAGFGPVLAHLEKQNKAAAGDIEGVPADPEPADDPAPATDGVSSSAPIVIPDDEPAVGSSHLDMPAEELRVVRHSEPVQPDAEQIDGMCLSAPGVMPPCQDDESREVLPMPLIESDEEEEPEGHAGCLVDGALFGIQFGSKVEAIECQEAEAETGPMPSRDDAPANECREDPHHHHHYSGCPYTGRCYPNCPSTGCPTTRPCDSPRPAAGGEDKSSKPADPTPPGDTTALKKIKRFLMREAIEDRPTHPEVDTMEFRPSDGQLYDYGSAIDL